MYKAGDIVRRITEDGTGEIVRVLEDQDYESEALYIATGNDDSDSCVDPGDYELVTEDQPVHEGNKPMSANTPTRTQEEIHEDICKMLTQVVQFVRGQGNNERVRIEISGDNHLSDSNLDVIFKVCIGYNTEIESDNLFKSARVAVSRFSEDKMLKPLSIPMFKE